MFEHIKLYLLFRIIMDDSFLVMPPTIIVALNNLLSMCGQLREHLFVLFLGFFELGVFGNYLLSHIIFILGGKYRYESIMIEIYA